MCTSHAHTQVGSRSGKLLCDKLDVRKLDLGIVQEASRCLANLWASEPVPDVAPLVLADNSPARPALVSGRWLLQEFSLRGESLALVTMLLSFDERCGAFSGGGRSLTDEGAGGAEEQFAVAGKTMEGRRQLRGLQKGGRSLPSLLRLRPTSHGPLCPPLPFLAP